MDKRLEKQGVKTRQIIYDFLVDFITENGYSPSVREITEATGLKSTFNVHNHLMTLERLGKIHMEKNKQRTISLVGYQYRKVG